MQARRQQYLSAMGVQVWLQRDDPDTASAAQQEADIVEALGPVSSDTAPQLERTLASEPASPTETLALHQAEDAQSDTSRKTASDTALQRPAEDAPEFRLVSIVFPDIGVLVTGVPNQSAEPVNGQQLTYYRNLLFALGFKSLPEPQISLFTWPMLRSPNFDQGEAAACEASQAFLGAQKTRHNTRFVILMGDVAGRYLLSANPGAGSDKAGLFERADEPVISIPTVDEVFEQPTLKALVWQQLLMLRNRVLD
jgi:hypothetical protein